MSPERLDVRARRAANAIRGRVAGHTPPLLRRRHMAVHRTVVAVLALGLFAGVAAALAIPLWSSLREAGPAAGVGEGSDAWGPLAVVPRADGVAEALIEGALHITEECVFLSEQGEDVLLVWPEDRTTWDAEAGTITFRNLDGDTVLLATGDEVRMSGGGSSTNEGGVSNENWAAGIDWVSPPSPSCVTGTRWFVGAEVVKL